MKSSSFNAFLAFLLFVVVGCDLGPRLVDETANQKLWGGYVAGGDYRLIAPVFLCGFESYRDVVAPNALRPQGFSEVSVPMTVDEYRANPGKWPGTIGVLDAGTQVRVTHIRIYENIDYQHLSVYADIVSDGSRFNDIVIDGISRPVDSEPDLLGPNLNVIELVPK